MTRRHVSIGLPLGLGLALAACGGAGPKEPTPDRPSPLQVIDERAGLALADEGWGDGATRLVYLDQGWNPAETLWYYFASQGSELMPYDMFLHLEQPGSEEPLASVENMVRFRFLPQRKTPNNPDALPVGLVRNGDHVGLTCAACHTAQINYRGTAMRVDGAPSLIDMIGLFREIHGAIEATLADEQKLARYVAKVKGPGDDTARVAAARASLSASLSWFESYLTVNASTTVEGYGRLDAIGRIMNQVIRFTSDPKHSLEPNAPTNFPTLWDTPRHDFVQWPGFSPNAGPGSVGRNAGEVVGVFGKVEVQNYKTEAEAKKGYASTVKAMALVEMEESLRGLKSPVWPDEILPPIDRALAERGAQIYAGQCQSCHALIDRADPDRSVTAMVTGVDVVKTDATAVENFVAARAPTGILEGARNATTGETYGAEERVAVLLTDVVGGVLGAQPAAVIAAMANARLHGLEETEKQGDHTRPTAENPTADLMAYKARPLNGVWATAPFLHNGSVPTLYDLLLPPDARPKTFTLGRREFDPRKVGYVSDGEAPFVVDTALTGNGNGGHAFGAKLSDDERWALVEYLKSL